MATLLLNSLIEDQARVLNTSIHVGIQAAFIGDEQNDESVTCKKGVEGGTFYVVLARDHGCKLNRWLSIFTSAT